MQMPDTRLLGAAGMLPLKFEISIYWKRIEIINPTITTLFWGPFWFLGVCARIPLSTGLPYSGFTTAYRTADTVYSYLKDAKHRT